MKIEEQNVIRATIINKILPRFEAAFPEAIRVPGTNKYLMECDGELVRLEAAVSTINGCTRNGKGDKYNLDAILEKANAELAEKKTKRLERESRPKKSTEPIDHTDFDNEVWAKLAGMDEPVELKEFFAANDWDEGITIKKLTPALCRLRKAGRVESLDGDKNKKLWKVA